jgi:hypothetical protein
MAGTARQRQISTTLTELKPGSRHLPRSRTLGEHHRLLADKPASIASEPTLTHARFLEESLSATALENVMMPLLVEHEFPSERMRERASPQRDGAGAMGEQSRQ